MSDDHKGLDSPPWLDATEILPRGLEPGTRLALREMIRKIHRENEWANRLQMVMDDADRNSRVATAAENFIAVMESSARKHNAERDAKIAELEARIASHVCAGPTTINLTENAAVQEYTAELRRELAEERNHVRQHKATIGSQALTIERLRGQVLQAQQEAGKDRRAEECASCDDLLSDRDRFYDMAESLADAAADLLQVNIGEHSNTNDPHRNALEAIKAAHAIPSCEPSIPAPDCEQLKADFMAARDSVAERLGRVKELLHTGPYDQVGREIEEALKELAGVPF